MTDLEIKMLPQRRSQRAETIKSQAKESPVKLASDEDRQFMPDDVVWAKVVGYPWWPAKVIAKSYPRYITDEGNGSYKKKEVTYCVEFFGQPAHAYLDDSKVAKYLTNRDYFIQLAKKCPKKFSADHFNESVKSADLICQNPDVVSDSQSIVSSPKKVKQKAAEEKIQKKGRRQESFLENQTKIKINKGTNSSSKNPEKPVRRTSETDMQVFYKLSKLILRVLSSKNKGKFSYDMLKKVAFLTMKKQKCLKKIRNNELKDVMSLFEILKSMTIDQVVTNFEKKKSFLPYASHKQKPLQQNIAIPSDISTVSSLIYQKYIYVDQLGNQSICSLPLKRYDFYIDLN